MTFDRSEGREFEPEAMLIDAIFAELGHEVEGVVSHTCRGTPTASYVDDIVQDAFWKLWKALHAPEYQHFNPGNWRESTNKDTIKRILFGAAKYARIRYFRRCVKREEYVADLTEVTEIPTELNELPLDLLNAAIESCPELQKQILRLKQNGLENSEIAEQLGMTESAVRGHFHRAKLFLRETIRM